MSRRSIVISGLVLVELLIIFALAKGLHSQLATTAAVSNPLKKENLVFPQDTTLKYFHEPSPNLEYKGPSLSSPDVIVTYRHNADYLNERFDYESEKPDGVFRIITLGDSWTYGLGVSTEDNYSEVLEDLLNEAPICEGVSKFEVMNLGQSGYDIEYSVERFKRRGEKYNPDMVIWLLKDDDFFIPSEIFRSLEELYSLDKRNDLAVAVNEKILEEFSSEEVIQYQEKSLLTMNDYYRGTLMFLLYSVSSDQRVFLENFAKLRGGTILYEKKSLNEREVVRGDGHPNKAGHRAFAEELLRELRKYLFCGRQT